MGSERMMALKAAKSEVVMALHSSSVTTFAVYPKGPTASVYSTYWNWSTNRRSSAAAEAARLAKRPNAENFMVIFQALMTREEGKGSFKRMTISKVYQCNRTKECW